MALSLDEKVDPERRAQFASQMEHVPKEIRAWFEETFNGEHSKEFYEGLLSAYANMHVMVQNLPPEKLKQYSGPIIAFVASHLQELYEECDNLFED